jgi:hypothetical protein
MPSMQTDCVTLRWIRTVIWPEAHVEAQCRLNGPRTGLRRYMIMNEKCGCINLNEGYRCV